MKPSRYLALFAIPLIGYQLWTIAGWIADGPFQITQYRDHGSVSWYAARVLEAVVVASVAGFVMHAVRGYRREGRIGVDGMLIIGMASAAFWDPVYNWLTPAWFYSSNFLNVNDWLAHAPLIVNPDAGTIPWPVIIVLVGYPLWGVGFAIVTNGVMHRARARWPDISASSLVAVAFACSAVITAIAFAAFQALDLMTAPGYRLGFLGDSQLLFFGYSGGIVFGGLACLRFFRMTNGVLATIAACQLLVVVGWGLLTVPASLHSSPYPAMPRHRVNGLCDAPGWHGTRYGPCPGSGFRLPIE